MSFKLAFFVTVLSSISLAFAAPMPQAGGAPDINSIIASLRAGETGGLFGSLTLPTATAVPGVFEAAPVHAAPVQKRVFTGGAPPLNPAIIDRLKQAQ